MSEINPYQAPQSDVSAPDDNYGEITIFSLQGRIGRMRYFVYTMVFTIILQLVSIPVVLIFMGTGGVTTLAVFTVIIAVIATVVSAFFVVQRLHDFNVSGWWYLMVIAPSLFLAIGPAFDPTIYLTYLPVIIGLWLAVVVFYLVLLFMPGNKASNRFGLEPPPNSTAIKVTVWVFVGLMVLFIVLGIVGAILAPRV